MSESEEITVEVDGWTAQQLHETAWEYGVNRQELLRRLCKNAAEHGPA